MAFFLGLCSSLKLSSVCTGVLAHHAYPTRTNVAWSFSTFLFDPYIGRFVISELEPNSLEYAMC